MQELIYDINMDAMRCKDVGEILQIKFQGGGYDYGCIESFVVKNELSKNGIWEFFVNQKFPILKAGGFCGIFWDAPENAKTIILPQKMEFEYSVKVNPDVFLQFHPKSEQCKDTFKFICTDNRVLYITMAVSNVRTPKERKAAIEKFQNHIPDRGEARQYLVRTGCCTSCIPFSSLGRLIDNSPDPDFYYRFDE